MWVSTGCTVTTVSTYTPGVSAGGSKASVRAMLAIDERTTRDGEFIGLALSGGGSRAAIFATAVMLELQRLGVLQRVDVISAVSGGGLPATYYALEGYRNMRFNGDTLAALGQDFQSEWIKRWFYPHNFLRYAFTSRSRSDTLVEVLDDRVFHGATYADLNPDRPVLLLNSTNAQTADRFVFAQESFAALDPSLADFPLAQAVYMSSAYPGLFRPVKLNGARNNGAIQDNESVVLYDGGPIDNLGVTTLVEQLRAAEKQRPLAEQFPRGCRIISVDATPRPVGDVKGLFSAPYVLLFSQRRDVLERAGIPSEEIDHLRVASLSIDGRDTRCQFRHIALRQLPDDDPLGALVTRIETNLGLSASDQAALIAAAKRLVQQHTDLVSKE